MKQYRSKKAGAQILRTYDLLVSEWGVDVREYMLNTRYGRTHILEAGDKAAPGVVLFHGVGDDSALMWLYNAKALAAKYRIYAVDTIGGPGKSEMGEAYDKRFDDALWIDDIFDALGLESAFVVGVSHGAYLAKMYAVHRPERVSKAICIASALAVSSDGKSASSIRTMMKIFMPEALIPTKRNIDRLIRKLSGARPEAFTDNPLVMEHYRWLLRGFNNMAMGYHKVTPLSPEQIDTLRGKAYFLVGERDPFQLLGGKDTLVKHNMNARFYPDGGHGLNHELADEINSTLDDILSGRLTELREV